MLSTHPNPTHFRRLILSLQVTLVLTLLTIIVSCYIRLAESGLDCNVWPDCFGYHHTDERSQGVTVLTSTGDQSPLRLLRVIHRIVASLLGIVIFGLFVVAHGLHFAPLLGRAIPYSLLIVTLLLASIGNIHPDQPIPLLTTTNLLGGMTLLALVWMLYVRVKRLSNERKAGPRDVFSSAPVKRHTFLFIRAGLILIIVQLFLGAWTSANYAGSSCQDLIDCENVSIALDTVIHSYTPSKMLPITAEGKVIIDHNSKTIQLFHHLGALITLAYFTLLCDFLIKNIKSVKNICFIVFGLLVFQIFVGIASIPTELPLVLIVIHNLLGAFLLVAITHLNMQVHACSEDGVGVQLPTSK